MPVEGNPGYAFRHSIQTLNLDRHQGVETGEPVTVGTAVLFAVERTVGVPVASRFLDAAQDK